MRCSGIVGGGKGGMDLRLGVGKETGKGKKLYVLANP